MTGKSIAVSVVIPTYNRSKTVVYAVRSILAQTYPVAEIIIVDDGSTDNTVEVVQAINDPRIRVIVQDSNHGAQAARNRGIREAANEWIALHDSDDEWLPTRLEEGIKALAAVNNDSLTLVHCNCYKYYTEDDRKVLWELPEMDGTPAEVLPKILKEPGPMFQGMLVSKSALQQIGLLDETVPSYQEWDTAICLAKICRFIHIKQPLFLYFFHGGVAISKGKNSTISGYHFNRLKHKQDTIEILGEAFFEKDVRWNIERAFDYGDFKLTQKLIEDTYVPSSISYIYLSGLIKMQITPKQVLKAIDPFKRPFRLIKRILNR